MPVHNIVRGQKVTPQKQQQAVILRRIPTQPEQVLWQHLRRNRIRGLHFRRQQIIDGFIVDFYCHAASLVIELDGGIPVDQMEHDAERQNILESKDLFVLRFTNDQVLCDLENVLSSIETACADRVNSET